MSKISTISCKKTCSVANPLPGVVDLFCGCSGFGLGFASAGFPLAGGVDNDSSSVRNSLFNLHSQINQNSDFYSCEDLTVMSAENLPLKLFNSYIVVGGPPCQAYSKAGRGKLRSLGKRRQHIRDPRGTLYEHFLRIALDLEPQAILMENVPDALDYGGLNIAEEASIALEDAGYHAGWSILSAADFGVPQLRTRMFLLAVRRNLADRVTFPQPSHCPPVRLEHLIQQRNRQYADSPHYIPVRPADPNAQTWITVNEAFSDLPSLFPKADTRYRLVKPNLMLPYKTEPQNQYQIRMRSWTGKQRKAVTGNSFRRTQRDFPIFSRMKPGDDYLKASEIADKLLEKACEDSGVNETDFPKRYQQLRKDIVPPYSRSKFMSKWKRLHPEFPSHTVVAHLSVDTYSHIHPWEPRGISIREAARLQSIPDDYLFSCSMGDAFKQIGNAVPPLLAEALAKHIREIIENGVAYEQ